jgi:hypothetical protein
MAKWEQWVIVAEVGGYVCSYPDSNGLEGICGFPVESEPCPKHANAE